MSHLSVDVQIQNFRCENIIILYNQRKHTHRLYAYTWLTSIFYPRKKEQRKIDFCRLYEVIWRLYVRV